MQFHPAYILLIIGASCTIIGSVWLSMYTSDKTSEMNQRILEKDEFILSNITGGDSFCYLMITGISADGNRGRWIVAHKGNYPLYGVHIDITDLDRSRELPAQPTIQQVFAIKDRLTIGDIPPARAGLLLDKIIELGGKTHLRFNIFISARNGFVVQHLRMRRIKNHWVSATRVFKIIGEVETKLFEKIDPNYPRDDADNIEWY